MILEPGEKVHVVERRFFQEDIQRHFVGEVLNCTKQAVRLKGYTWILNPTSDWCVRKPEQRERIIPLGPRLTINLIPSEVNLAAVRYIADPNRGLLVTDEKEFYLEITEFGPRR